MADFYTPPEDPILDLTLNSRLVVAGLGSDKSGISSSNNIIEKPIGISSIAISRYQIPTKKLDEDLLVGIGSILDQINNKKQEIIDLSNIALSGYVPGINPPICQLASDGDSLDSPIISEDGKLNSSPPLIGSGSGLPGLETPDIAFGVVRGDELRVWRAPYLEQRIAPNDFAFENLKYPILTLDIAGQGKENIIFQNSKYNIDGITIYCWNDEGNWSTQEWEGDNNTLGRYYKIIGPGIGTARLAGVYDEVTQIFTLDGEYSGMLEIVVGITTGNFSVGGAGTGIYSRFNPSTRELTSVFTSLPIPSGPGYFTFSSVGICNSLINQIDALESEIEDLRVGLSTILEPPNILKRKKHNEQIKLWSLKRVEIKNTEEVDNIGIATESIVTIDPTLPTQSNSFDDQILTTFDSSLVTFDSF